MKEKFTCQSQKVSRLNIFIALTSSSKYLGMIPLTCLSVGSKRLQFRSFHELEKRSEKQLRKDCKCHTVKTTHVIDGSIISQKIHYTVNTR